MSKMTIREVARLAGVSPAAVSFVINGKKGVSNATRKNIQLIIEETGYMPDNNSRRFYFKKTFTVALISSPTVSPFDDIFYYEIAKGLDYESRTLGYSVIFSGIRHEAGNIVLPHVIRAKDTDGLIFLQDIPSEIRNIVQKIGLPYVVVDASDPTNTLNAVYADYEQAAYTATMYLIERGHTAVAFLGANLAPPFYMNTFMGYRRAMEEIHAPIPSHWIQANANDDASVIRCVDAILSRESRPTAIFCATDMIAIAAMNYTRSKGLTLPGDLSFIGIDDVMLSSYVYPSLTTVRVDKFQMGKVAMDLIMKRIRGKEAPSCVVELGGVMERESVALL